MKFIILFSLTLPAISSADVWQKPPYRPDENHLPHVIYHRQAQEENPHADKKAEMKNNDKNKKKEKEKLTK